MKNNKLCIPICIVIIIVLSIFISWFFYLNDKTKPREMQCSSFLIINDSLALDSIADTYSFMIRANRMEEEISTLKDKYQSEVDLMVDKANGWLAFWIGILTLLMGLMSIWQIYRQNKNENEFHRLEQDIKDELGKEILEIENTIDEQVNVFNEKIKKAIDEQVKGLKDRIENMQQEIEKAQQTLRASKLSSLMMCLSSLPDPQMTSESADKRRQMYTVLKNISNTFHEYTDSLGQEIAFRPEERERAYLVLTVVKLAIVRTHGIYSDIHQNIRIQQLLDIISNTTSEILDGRTTNQLTKQIKEIDLKLSNLLSIIDK